MEAADEGLPGFGGEPPGKQHRLGTRSLRGDISLGGVEVDGQRPCDPDGIQSNIAAISINLNAPRYCLSQRTPKLRV
jgi:hypothetical protein